MWSTKASMRLFDRGGSGDDPVARRRPRQRSPPPAAAQTQNEIRRVSLRRRSIPYYCLARAREGTKHGEECTPPKTNSSGAKGRYCRYSNSSRVGWE